MGQYFQRSLVKCIHSSYSYISPICANGAPSYFCESFHTYFFTLITQRSELPSLVLFCNRYVVLLVLLSLCVVSFVCSVRSLCRTSYRRFLTCPSSNTFTIVEHSRKNHPSIQCCRNKRHNVRAKIVLFNKPQILSRQRSLTRSLSDRLW